MEKNLKKWLIGVSLVCLVAITSELVFINAAMKNNESQNKKIAEINNKNIKLKTDHEIKENEFNKEKSDLNKKIDLIEKEVNALKTEKEKISKENDKLKELARRRKLNSPSRGASRRTQVDIVVSHYCSCSSCNGSWTGQPTASGVRAVAGRTIATPSNLLGKNIYVEGYGMRTAEDTGNPKFIRWIEDGKKVKIDMFVSSHKEAMDKGIVHTKGIIY